MEDQLDRENSRTDATYDRLKYQNDLLAAMNERLVDSDRMYKMIALSTGELYLYRNFRHDITEFTGPWETLLPCRPDPHSFRMEEITALLAEGEAFLFTERILNMEETGQETSTLLLRFAGNKGRFLCKGTVYYDENGKPTDKLIGFRSIG